MLLALAVAALVLVPVVVTFSSFARVEGSVLAHLIEFTLPELVANTLWLVFGVGLGVSVLGVSLAWLTAMCEFPGRRLFGWALLLPLALPAYVTAFVAIGLLDFTGPLQTWLREGWGITGLPEIRSRGGVILVMSLALYPYVYLIAKNAFATQGAIALEAAQSLGLSRRQGFFRVALPMARPWIAAGLMLALMETLADFGTMAIFNYDTFTTAIYKAWYSLFSLAAAAQLASILILFVLVAVVFEQRSRTRMRYGAVGRSAAQRRIRLSPLLAGLALRLRQRGAGHRLPHPGDATGPVGARRHRQRPRRPLLDVCLAFAAAGRHRCADGGGGGAVARLRRAPAPRQRDDVDATPGHHRLCLPRRGAGGGPVHPGGLAGQLADRHRPCLVRFRRLRNSQGHAAGDAAGLSGAFSRGGLRPHRQRPAPHHAQRRRSRDATSAPAPPACSRACTCRCCAPAC